MGVVTYKHEATYAVPPEKLFKAFVLDGDNLIPKILPQAIKSIETLQGDGGPGSIKVIHFGEGSQFKSVKHRVDELNKESFTYSYSIIEGDALGDILESISYTSKVEPSGHGGSVVKNISTYHTKGDIKIKEEDIKSGKEKAEGLLKAVEAYLVANPDY